MQFCVRRAIERLLTPPQSSDRRIDVHVIFNRFQPYFTSETCVLHEFSWRIRIFDLECFKERE